MFKVLFFYCVMVFSMKGYTVCEGFFSNPKKKITQKIRSTFRLSPATQIKTKMKDALNRNLTSDEISFIEYESSKRILSQRERKYYNRLMDGTAKRDYTNAEDKIRDELSRYSENTNLFNNKGITYQLDHWDFIKLMREFSIEDIKILADKYILRVSYSTNHNYLPGFIKRVQEMELLLNKGNKPLSDRQIHLGFEIADDIDRINYHKENDPDISYSLKTNMEKLGMRLEQLLHSFPKNQQEGGIGNVLPTKQSGFLTLKADKHNTFLEFLNRKTKAAKAEGRDLIFPPDDIFPFGRLL